MKKFAITLAIAALSACTQIDTGNVGVERTLGKVSETALPTGVYFTMFKHVDEFTTKEVSFQINDMTPKSRDNLTMTDVDIDVYYKTTPSKVPSLFIKYQGDMMMHNQVVKDGTTDFVIAYGRVMREAREAVYNAIAKLDATTMHTKRAELAESVRSILQKELDANDPGAFTITAVNVRNLVTDKALESAIRDRVGTEQAIERKNREIELAKAEAARLLVEAEGQAKANRAISESLTPALKEIRLAEINRDTAAFVSNKAGNTVFLNSSVTPLVQVK